MAFASPNFSTNSVKEQEPLVNSFTSSRFICSLDVYLNGGRVNTGKDAVEWAKEAEALGAGEILLTSMDCDGVKKGYDIV